MERDHLPPVRDVPEEVETLTMDQVEVKSYVGGLVKSFERKAARVSDGALMLQDITVGGP